MDHRYVRIEAAKPISPQDSTSSSVGTAPLPPKRRRTGVALACDVCRRKKIRCEGSKPSCSSCSRAGVVCNYSERGLIEAENARDASTLQMLRSLPSPEAGRLLETIRTSDEEESLTASPSLTAVLWSHLSPTRNRVEFELMVRHPISYPALFPLDAASLPLESLLRPSRILVTRQDPDSFSPNQSPSDHFSTEVRLRYFPTRPLVDHRLRDLQIDHWTNVRVNNALAASILSLYIETDYQSLPMFNLDLFLEDLISNKPYFCSKLLVNSLFSWICQSYSSIDPDVSELATQFFTEAQTLICDGPQLVTLTAVSALQFLSLAAISYGHDRLGLEYLQKGVAIGTDMGLFGRGSGNETASTWLGNEDDWRRSASYTAWGVHNWVSLYSFRYRLDEIMAPPRIPMPGSLDAGPPTERIVAQEVSLHTKIFKASCELWILSYDLRRARQQAATTNADFLTEVQDIFSRYLSWAASLPLNLVRSDESNHAVAMMHIYFHIIIVDMFREVSHRSDEPFRMHSFETRQIFPRAIYSASVNQLKRLLLAYRTFFQTATISILLQTVLIYVGNAALLAADEMEQPECQFYLRVCLAGLKDLYGSYRQAWGMMKGLLSMSLKRGAMEPDEAGRIMREMMVLGQHHKDPGETKSSSMMDLELATTDPSAAQVNRVAEQFDALMLTAKFRE